jgi:hypothetical protein
MSLRLRQSAIRMVPKPIEFGWLGQLSVVCGRHSLPHPGLGNLELPRPSRRILVRSEQAESLLVNGTIVSQQRKRDLGQFSHSSLAPLRFREHGCEVRSNFHGAFLPSANPNRGDMELILNLRTNRLHIPVHVGGTLRYGTGYFSGGKKVVRDLHSAVGLRG